MPGASEHELGELGRAFNPYLAGGQSFYTTGEDRLRLRAFNSAAGVTLNLEARTLRVDGSIAPTIEPHVPNTDGTISTLVVNMCEGWLQNVAVRAAIGSPRVGQCFVIVDLIRGQTGAVVTLGILLQGYVQDTTGLAWPGSLVRSSAEGPGAILTIAGADPGAGAEFLITVPTNRRWRLIGLAVTLVASAAAANRESSLVLDDGANVFARIPSRLAHVASETRVYSGGQGLMYGTVAQDNSLVWPMATYMLMSGYRIRSITTNIQAGDDYGIPRALVEEWIED